MKGPRKGGVKDKPPKRIDAMRASGIAVALPPNPLPYVTDWLMEIGPTVPAAMSYGAVGWRDLAAWQGVTGIELLPWEATIIRQLSCDFAGEVHRAEDPACPAPWAQRAGLEQNRDAVARKLGMMFKSLAMAQAKPAEPRKL